MVDEGVKSVPVRARVDDRRMIAVFVELWPTGSPRNLRAVAERTLFVRRGFEFAQHR